LADNIITKNEMDDLVEVTRLLGFDRPMLDQVLFECGGKGPAPVVSVETPTLVGKTVCFTGELSGEINGMRIERQKARELAQAAGLIVADNITKKLDILVASAPATLSGKAKKAREHGTRIMAKMPFWKAINVKVDWNGRPGHRCITTIVISPLDGYNLWSGCQSKHTWLPEWRRRIANRLANWLCRDGKFFLCRSPRLARAGPDYESHNHGGLVAARRFIGPRRQGFLSGRRSRPRV
jgi:hypothetical protein